MAKFKIEVVGLRETYFDDDDIQQEYIVYEYLVKRAKDDCPVRQFKTYAEACDYIAAREPKKKP